MPRGLCREQFRSIHNETKLVSCDFYWGNMNVYIPWTARASTDQMKNSLCSSVNKWVYWSYSSEHKCLKGSSGTWKSLGKLGPSQNKSPTCSMNDYSTEEATWGTLAARLPVSRIHPPPPAQSTFLLYHLEKEMGPCEHLIKTPEPPIGDVNSAHLMRVTCGSAHSLWFQDNDCVLSGEWSRIAVLFEWVNLYSM